MLEHLRRSAVLSMLALFAFATVLGGKEVMHYMFMHQQPVEHTEEHLHACCKLDHRLPHFHASQYCFLCNIEASVILHSEHYTLPNTSLFCTGVFTSEKTTVNAPAHFACHDLRGPPPA